MLAVWIVLGVLGLLIILFLIALFSVYKSVFYTPKEGQNDDFHLNGSQYDNYHETINKMITKLKSIPYEDVYTISYDKLKLHARFYEAKESNKVAICCHGYRGTAYRDFSGGAAAFIEMGINVILIDERGHGLSEGHSITFGRKEHRDVVSWVNFAKEKLGRDIEIIIVGISMGGASVLFASDKVGEAKVIADCPYTTEKEIICQTIKYLKLPVKLFFPIVNLSSIIYGHASLTKDDAAKSIANTDNKILIIHGDNDSIVPHTFSERVAKLYPNKIRYELFPNAGHGMSYIFNKERYIQVIKEFLDE